MRHIWSTLLILAAGTSSSFAQTMLKVSLIDRRPITVSVDGRHFRKAGESVTVNDLPRGRHYVIVYVQETLANGRVADGIIWEGKVKTYQGHISLCVIDPHNREASVTEQDMYAVQPAQNADAQTYNNYNLNNYDVRDNGTQQPATQPDNIQPDVNYTPLPEGTPVASPVSGSEEDEPVATKPAKNNKATAKTDKQKAKINTKNTDTEKLTIAKDILKKETFTTAQVVSIMDCFSFEDSRMEFAKWAYPKTTDKANYKQTKQKFTLKKYREEMDKFLRDNK